MTLAATFHPSKQLQTQQIASALLDDEERTAVSKLLGMAQHQDTVNQPTGKNHITPVEVVKVADFVAVELRDEQMGESN